jgi:hypothetical protein
MTDLNNDLHTLPKEIISQIIQSSRYKTICIFRLTCKYYCELTFNIEFWEILAQKELNFTPFVFTECWNLINKEIIIMDINNSELRDMSQNYDFKTKASHRIVLDLIEKVTLADIDSRIDLYNRVQYSYKNFFDIIYSKMNWNKMCELSRVSKNHIDGIISARTEIFHSICNYCEHNINEIRDKETLKVYPYDENNNLYCCKDFNIIVKSVEDDIIVIGEFDNCNNISACSKISKKIFDGMSYIKFVC